MEYPKHFKLGMKKEIGDQFDSPAALNPEEVAGTHLLRGPDSIVGIATTLSGLDDTGFERR